MTNDSCPSQPEFDLAVVMPVRDAVATLPVALDALVQQRATCRWQLIVVDDGSRDDTPTIASTRDGCRLRSMQPARAVPSVVCVENFANRSIRVLP